MHHCLVKMWAMQLVVMKLGFGVTYGCDQNEAARLCARSPKIGRENSAQIAVVSHRPISCV